MLHRLTCRRLSSNLSSIRSALARAFEALSTSTSPRDDIAIGVCQGNDCIIKSRLNVCLTTQNGLAFTPPWPGCWFLFICRHAFAIPPRARSYVLPFLLQPHSCFW